mgnify:CR=1 FL=1
MELPKNHFKAAILAGQQQLGLWSQINDATVTVSDEMSCRATLLAPPSLIERIAFWNGGYTVSIITWDDNRDDYPVMLSVGISK